MKYLREKCIKIHCLYKTPVIKPIKSHRKSIYYDDHKEKTGNNTNHVIFPVLNFHLRTR